MSPDTALPARLADRTMTGDTRKAFLASTRLPSIQVRRCPSIPGYALLGRRPAGAWIVFRGATVAHRGALRWEPRNTTAGGSLCGYGRRPVAGHYRRVAGARAALHEGQGWARHAYGRRMARGLPVTVVPDQMRELVS